jgi:hypothetical protein
MAIYVERFIRTRINRLWTLTQTPQHHQRWDLRFSRIDYLPRADSTSPQDFIYVTRLGLGFSVSGTGTTAGERLSPAGTATSALVFRSKDSKSLIHKGSGYWQYFPERDGVRFVTLYDYRTRWGYLGWLLDRLFFRPLMACATAWSFDRLRAWLERGIAPETSLRIATAYALARLGVAGIWIYEGLFPKLLGPHPQELKMTASIMGESVAPFIVLVLGSIEVLLGAAMVLRWRDRWPVWLTLIAMPAAFAVVALAGPELLSAPFNVTTLNGAMMLLAGISLILRRDLVSADSSPHSAYARRLRGFTLNSFGHHRTSKPMHKSS